MHYYAVAELDITDPESRRLGARNQFFLVAGEDVNGVARIGD